MPTPREQNIARAMNLSNNMDEFMNEVLLALIVGTNAREGREFPGGAKVSQNGTGSPGDSDVPRVQCHPLSRKDRKGSAA